MNCGRYGQPAAGARSQQIRWSWNHRTGVSQCMCRQTMKHYISFHSKSYEQHKDVVFQNKPYFCGNFFLKISSRRPCATSPRKQCLPGRLYRAKLRDSRNSAWIPFLITQLCGSRANLRDGSQICGISYLFHTNLRDLGGAKICTQICEKLYLDMLSSSLSESSIQLQ